MNRDDCAKINPLSCHILFLWQNAYAGWLDHLILHDNRNDSILQRSGLVLPLGSEKKLCARDMSNVDSIGDLTPALPLHMPVFSNTEDRVMGTPL